MTKNTIKLRQFAIFCIDLIILFSSVFLTLLFRHFSLPLLENYLVHLLYFLPIIATWLILMYVMDMYNLNKIMVKLKWAIALLFSAFISTLVGFSLFYLFFSSISPRGFLMLYVAVSFVLLVFWRWIYTIVVKIKKELIHVLFIGYDSILEEIIPHLAKDNYFEYKMVGIFETSKELQMRIDHKEWLLKDKESLLKTLEQNPPDIIIISDDKMIDENIKLDMFSLMGKYQFILLHDFYEILLRKIPTGSIHDTWVLSNIDITCKHWFFVIKRIFDIIFSFSVLCIIFIPSIVLAIAIKLTSKGPVFFTQIREGKDGKHFTMIKFRTMSVEGNTFKPTEKKDARVTRLGHFLRQSRIDEFPQFINVLKGDMLVVGPRPERPELSSTFKTQVPFYQQRLLIKPGITGWEKVSGVYNYPSVEETIKKVQLDLYYIKNCSILLDLSIFAKTITIMFLRIGI